MIINIRVDHTIADIETMEKVSKDLKELFSQLKQLFNIREYIEINTCNRYEYFIYTNYSDDGEEKELLKNNQDNIIVQYNDDAILHLFRMTSGLESMIIGEDQILGQIKDARAKSIKEDHCGEKLDTHIDAMKKGVMDADFDLIREIANETDIFIIGNNSINSIQQAEKMLNAGASGISIARAAIKGRLDFDLNQLKL